MDELLDQVKKALAEATNGPWKVYEKVYEDDKPYLAERLIGTEYDHPQLKAPDSVVTNSVCVFEPHHRVYISKEDAHLIANAPTWLSSLVTTVESLQNEIASHAPEGRNYTNGQYVELLLKFESLQKDNERWNSLHPEVQWFAEQMELALLDNEHKGGWRNSSDDFLINQLYRNADKIWRTNPGILRRAANVANFAMMIADNSRVQDV